MADLHRQRLIEEVDTRLKTILISNGYLTDIGETVRHWYTAQETVDALHYRDVRQDPADSPESYNQDYWSLIFEVEVALISDNATPEYARQVFADIYKALGTDDLWTITVTDPADTELATGTRYLGDAMQVDHEERKIFAPFLSFAIDFNTTVFDPFIQGT